MKKLLIAAVATLMVACVITKTSRPRNTLERASHFALDYVCEVLQDDCTDIPVPVIHFDTLRLQYNIGGTVTMKDGALAPLLDITQLSGFNWTPEENPAGYAILIHEMVHYVDILNGRAPTEVGEDADADRAAVCASEGRAFQIANYWYMQNGLYDLVRFDWMNSYPACQGRSF